MFLRLQNRFENLKINLKMHFAFLRATFFDNLAHISLLKPSLKTGTQSFTYEKDKNGQQLLFSGFLAQSRWEREEEREIGRERERER